MRFDLDKISSHYIIKPLTEACIPEVYILCQNNQTYYQYMKTEPTFENIKDTLSALPPNKTIEDKYFVGFYRERQLIAILDLITDYPEIGTAYIGWFMMDTDFQGTGVGSEIIKKALIFLKNEKFHKVRLGCIKDNKEGINFWLKNGFKSTGAEVETADYIIVVMERKLEAEKL